MSPHQIIAVAVRLFAVWLAVTTVVSAPSSYVRLLEAEGSSMSASAVVIFAAVLALGIVYLLWRFPLTIAGKLLAPSAQEPAESASPDLWLSMGCALIGLWLLVQFVPLLARDLMVVFEGYSSDGAILKLRLATDLPGVLIGLWLVFGAKGFRKVFWWARNAGRNQPDK
jgi:hypothetical protein